MKRMDFGYAPIYGKFYCVDATKFSVTGTSAVPLPTSDAAIANKAYVDQEVANEVFAYTHKLVNSDYTLLEFDHIIGVDTSTAPVTITLPLISGLGLKRYVITDEGGNASTNKITVAPTPTDTINGAASTEIVVGYNSITVYNNGASGWFLS